MRARAVVFGVVSMAAMLAACNAVQEHSGDPEPVASAASALASDWVIAIDPSNPGPKWPLTLLGQYDVSGAQFQFDYVPGLAAAMGGTSPQTASLPGNVWSGVGFTEWRVGVGLALPGTLLLPTLTNGTTCTRSPRPPQSFAPDGWTDLDVIASRDWFVDDGLPVTVAMTGDNRRYSLSYVRSVIDTATALGASPWVDIDVMPRALAVNRTPSRSTSTVADACDWTLTNAVTNARPANPDVFAAAATGLVKRVVEGSDGERARAVKYWELWNEPELPYFWDPTLESTPGRLDRFFDMSVRTLVRLDAYRASSTNADVRQLRFGLGSFLLAGTAASTLTRFDAAATPTSRVPLDFVSFHSYDDDPARIVGDVRQVAAARAATTHYRNVELALTEWGPSLTTDSKARSMTSMDFPLLVSSVLSLGAAAGLSHAHQALFWDNSGILPYGLLDHDVKPRPIYWAYALLSRVVGGFLYAGARRLVPAGLESGELDGGMGAVIASRDAFGKTRVLLTNRGATARSARVDVGGATRTPSLVLSMTAPRLAPVAVTPTPSVVVPPRSIVLVEL